MVSFRILITGAEGFVGSNLTPKLDAEHEVIALDFLTSHKKSNLPRSIPYLNEDLSSVDIPKLPKVDLIIHLAIISIERVSESSNYEQINITSTLKMLELAKKHKSDLILASSGSVYGSGVNFKETSPFNPLSLYATGKINAERYANFYHRKYGLNITILRYTNCYGDLTYIDNKVYPGKKDVMRIFVENALADKPLPLVEGQSRDFTYIEDVVEATCSVIGLKGFNVFNVGTGVAVELKNIPSMIKEATGKPITVKMVPPRPIDNLQKRSLNIEKISPLWKPKYDLGKGLKHYAEKARLPR